MTDPLEAAIARTGEAIRLEGAAARWPWHFARSWLLATRVSDHGGSPAELDAAVADFHQLPVDAPGRPKLAAVLVATMLQRALVGADARQAIALAAVADTDPEPLPNWAKAAATVRTMHVMRRVQPGARQMDLGAALDEIDRCAAVVGDEEPYAHTIALARSAVHYQRMLTDRDFGSLQEAVTTLTGLSRATAGDPRLGPRAALLAESFGAMQSLARGDVPAAEAALARLERLYADLPPELRGGSAAAIVDTLRAGIHMLHEAAGLTAADRERVRAQADLPGADPAQRSSNLAMLGVMDLAGPGVGGDQGVERLRAALAGLSVGSPFEQEYRMLLGAALIMRYEERHDPDDLADGLSALGRARALAESPAHPQWATTLLGLGHAYRLAGHAERGRAAGVAALRGHTWGVLLQTGTVERTNAGGHAASDAVDVARWCIHDNDAAAAMTALDAGRSLMLFAATEHRSVADRLLARGEPALAARWRAAIAAADVTALPLELRRSILHTLAEDGRLDPPAPDAVRRALGDLGLDALVYLVPGDEGLGAAVIVHADRPPEVVGLPEIRRGFMPDLTVLVRGGPAVRDLRPGSAQADVGPWAWRAAVSPVLKRVTGAGGRLPRIALIPMRELALVPWHAARTVEDGRVVHAVERAVFTYALSARLLCDSAAAPPVPPSDVGLFVGDPDTGDPAADLPAARAEAWAIRERFYPRARYVGRRPDGTVSPAGPGSADDIVGLLSGPAAGSVLHLACHGAVEPVGANANPAPGEAPTGTAYLLLSGAERLFAERILAVAGQRPVGLVVLAACNTGVAGRGGRDEAFSLAATFLATGARTVISSLWRVPDRATSLLMYMFHHFLRAGAAPMDALHRAQLWMLDAGREVPADVPAALTAGLAATDLAAVPNWAGFVHIGR
ncbi:CHAT domain-containing protein [Dactylosporangium sp. NPDC051541]|uniref:CHAT domain-containing protein n=1 Tax=Dactylosporangium sp. NPDC051541 TaxID=3363977 RepID=UPI0037B5BB9A